MTTVMFTFKKAIFVFVMIAGMALATLAQKDDQKKPRPPKGDPPVVNPAPPKNPPKGTPTPEPKRPRPA